VVAGGGWWLVVHIYGGGWVVRPEAPLTLSSQAAQLPALGAYATRARSCEEAVPIIILLLLFLLSHTYTNRKMEGQDTLQQHREFLAKVNRLCAKDLITPLQQVRACRTSIAHPPPHHTLH
jgi:hypothetical protein